MKNKFMQTLLGTFLALLMLFGCTQIFVSGQISEKSEATFSQEVSGSDIEGVWQTTITQVNCQTGANISTFQGLLTFHHDGTIAETSASPSPALRTPGHGVWEKTYGPIYSGKFIFLRFNADGTFAGTQKVMQNFEVSRSTKTFYSTGSVQVLDQNGNLIASGCASSTGMRFQ